jgi:hypothetical protein
MKQALLFVALAACVTEPDIASTEQAVTDDVAAGDIGAECTADPAQALSIIEETFGAGSPEHVGGVNCWRQYDNDMRAANSLSNFCSTLPPMQRASCFQMVADMRHDAHVDYFWCLVWRSRWWCPWRWGGHTQTWSGGDHTQNW